MPVFYPYSDRRLGFEALTGTAPLINLSLLSIESGDILFHLSVRPEPGLLVLNTRSGGTWGQEVRIDLPEPIGARARRGEILQVVVEIRWNGLRVSLGGQRLFRAARRQFVLPKAVLVQQGEGSRALRLGSGAPGATEPDQLRAAFGQALAGDPDAPDAGSAHLDAILSRKALDDGDRQELCLTLVDHFCSQDRLEALWQLMVRHGLTCLDPEACPPWALSRLVPFEVLKGDLPAAQSILQRLVADPDLWTIPSGIAWACDRVLDTVARGKGGPQALDFLDTVLDFIGTRNRDYWGQGSCAELTRAVAGLACGTALPPDLAVRAERAALTHYGLSPLFWERVQDLPACPPALVQAKAGFDAFRSLVLKDDLGPARSALDALEAKGMREAPRMRAELGRPEGPLFFPAHLLGRPEARERAMELVSSEARLQEVNAAGLAVLSVLRNEMFMLPHFLSHYRRLGVRGFLIVDNLSDDGTAEYLAAQPDVALFRAPAPFSEAAQGTDWKIGLMQNFRLGRWSLVADTDEFLVPGQGRDLGDILARLEAEGADAVRVAMLDMYPRGPLAEADFSSGDPFAEAGYADRVALRRESLGRGPFGTGRTRTSALRHRLLPGSRPELFVSEKVPFLRYRPWMKLSVSLHYASNVQLSGRDMLFAHFKYNSEFRDKALREIARGQYWNGAEEYRRYLSLAGEGRGTLFDNAVSVPWTETDMARDLLD